MAGQGLCLSEASLSSGSRPNLFKEIKMPTPFPAHPLRPRTACALAALALTLTLVAAGASAADRPRPPLRSQSALSSPLGPLPPGANYDRPFPSAGSVSPQGRSDGRPGDARSNDTRGPVDRALDIRNADTRRDNLRRDDFEADAANMQSANRAPAIEGTLTRDPRVLPGARARTEAVPGVLDSAPVGGARINGASDASNPAMAGSGTGARSSRGSLSGGSVIGGVNGNAGTAARRW